MEYVFLVLFGIAWAVGTPIVAIVALARTSRLREQNDRLIADVARLRRQMAETALPPPFVEPPAAEVATPPPAPPVEQPAVEIAPAPPVEQPIEQPVEPPAVEIATPPPPGPPVEQPAVEIGTPPPPAPPFEPADEAPSHPSPVPMPPPIVAPVRVGWEQRLGARAFVWLGAVTLALAGVFLVRYSIEEGYLSPEVRVILAALFGFGLVGAAERMRGRDARIAEALAAAGVAALYGALFAAVALYDMISKPVAGGGALALTIFAIGVSLRHGMLVAGLAFVGGFVSPVIIGSETPNTPVLFGYLLAIAAGTLAVIRQRGWWLLGWGVLAGSAIWTVLWMWSLAGGLHWVGLFLVAVAGLFVWAAWRRVGQLDAPLDDVFLLVWAALALSGALIGGLIVQDRGVQAAGWLALAAHGVGLHVVARWRPRLQPAGALASVLSIAVLFLWWVAASEKATFDPERFEWIAISLGGLYALVAFAMLWNAARPGFWAALAVGAVFGHFLLSWYVLRGVATDTPWGLISIGLAVPFLVGAERIARWRGTMAGAVEALGIMAAGVTLFVAFAIAVELRREWITVAYAAEFAAVAAIASALGLHAMRQLCWPLLAVVVVRFALNPEVLSYPLGVTPIFNWILWGYGLAIAALAVGWRFLKPSGDARLVRATEAAIALLIFVLLTLEVRSIFQPDAMAQPATGFVERTFYVLVWGAFALAALWLARTERDPVALWAWRASGALSLGLVLVMQVVIDNPVRSHTALGPLPIATGLFLAYAVPAAMAALARYLSAGVETDRRVVLLIEAAAPVLAFVYVTLEVRHFFDPGFEQKSLATGFMERASYVLAWGAFALAALWLARTWRDHVALWTWRASGALSIGLMLVVQVLIANPVRSHPAVGQMLIANGLFLAYAVPAAMAVLARRWSVGVETDRRVVLFIEAVAPILAFVYVSLEVRHFFDPGFVQQRFTTSFPERASYVLVWGAFALAALWLARTWRGPVALWTWRASGALAIGLALVMQVLTANPVLSHPELGRLPIVNGLFLSYAVPAAMAALARRWIQGVEADRRVVVFIEAAISILIFAWVSLEVRHVFDPHFARPGYGASGLELYVYSAVWLLFGVALLALGFLRNAAAVRHVGMALVCIVVVKVFLIDMAGLQGLLRVFSFLGLGAALIGLGYAYRRLGLR